MLLKISTATTVTIGPVLDADGAAVTTAVVTNLSLSKNGSSAALTNENFTHVANGYYTLGLTSGNTNTLGNLEVFVNNTAMSMTVFRYNIIAAQVYDSIVSGSDLLQTDVREMLANVIDSTALATSAVSEIATGVRTELTTELNRIDVATSTRLSSASYTTPPTAAAIADGVWDEAYADHNIAGSFGKLLNTIRKANLTIDGVVSTAITPTTLTFSSNVVATTSAYAHAVLLFISGPLAGENSPIVSYTNANGVFVLEEPLTAAPSDGDEFVVIAGSHVHAIADIQTGLATSSGVTAGFTEIKGAGWSSADTLKEISDAAGAGNIMVTPVVAQVPVRVVGTNIETFIGDLSDIRVGIFSGSDPVNLTNFGDLEVCVQSKTGSDLDFVEMADLTIDGDDSNYVSWTPNGPSVETEGRYKWSLRKSSNKQVVAYGAWIIVDAALEDTGS